MEREERFETHDGLPEICFYRNKISNEITVLKRGIKGYFPYEHQDQDADIDNMNEEIGVTKAQSQAMYYGSLFGWHVPLSNPAMFDEKGNVRKDEF